MSVIHPQPQPEDGLKSAELLSVVPGHMEVSGHSVEEAGPQLRSTQQSHLALGLVLLAVSLLVVVVVVGVIRVRANARRQEREEQEVEMAWDDAALTITVNPLEVSISFSCPNKEKLKFKPSNPTLHFQSNSIHF